jgi:hypothetical protein
MMRLALMCSAMMDLSFSDVNLNEFDRFPFMKLYTFPVLRFSELFTELASYNASQNYFLFRLEILPLCYTQVVFS